MLSDKWCRACLNSIQLQLLYLHLLLYGNSLESNLCWDDTHFMNGPLDKSTVYCIYILHYNIKWLSTRILHFIPEEGLQRKWVWNPPRIGPKTLQRAHCEDVTHFSSSVTAEVLRGSDTCKNRSALIDTLQSNQEISLRDVHLHILYEVMLR